jgi:CubicO group peptidase (beta-lactamase class C family)
MFRSIIILILVINCFGCNKAQPNISNNAMYFPTATQWETTTAEQLNWNTAAIQPLKDYLLAKNTKSFMVLVNGKIVLEEYFNGHTPTAQWEWNSAGKTLSTAVIGIAQQEGFLQLNDRVAKHIGLGWTSTPLAKENLITIKHLLSMTTGLNDASELVIPANLTYVADAGTRWSYHNVFQKLMDVAAAASNQSFDNYFTSKLKNKIGMDGFWNNGIIFKIYHSNTRSMARFGLLSLNKGLWNGEQIVQESYFTESINSSQTINPSYGYLWWLNGKTTFMIPGAQTIFQSSLVPNAPADMYAAMGANDQRIYVVPSKKIVVIRMGQAANPANPSFAVSGFDNELWEKINAIIR